MQPLNYKDITVKAKTRNFESIELKLKELNATFLGTDFQTDYYFKTKKGKLKYRDCTIEKLITHYERIFEQGAERTIVYRYDLNPSEEQVGELYNSGLIGVIKKSRKIFYLEHIKIHLDELENGDQFIEIEAIDRDEKWTYDDLKKQCSNLRLKLEISDSDLIPTGYLTA